MGTLSALAAFAQPCVPAARLPGSIYEAQPVQAGHRTNNQQPANIRMPGFRRSTKPIFTT
jgi:hypothetical protein